ncbi:MAG: hypothetical protein RBS16_08940 [Candidatus Cloacimonadales bacterium]|jgi:hypothetical protein|nr:hypothetical protein [Candidatus Cloacimonadota bacterium]MDD2650113.1 hypothetical protein [Candidatus Cloacimonadota bacterium]MDX9978136.1 hypothetical protein [Candidatus Cloacimonadales bacterium]
MGFFDSLMGIANTKNCIFSKNLAIIVEKFGTKNTKNCIFSKNLAIIVEKFLNNFFRH